MDKVLKQRLVGASILIALAVIFLPMLFEGGGEQSVEQRELALDLPERESGDRQVRRLPLDPDQARRPPGESQAQPPGRTRAESADNEPEVPERPAREARPSGSPSRQTPAEEPDARAEPEVEPAPTQPVEAESDDEPEPEPEASASEQAAESTPASAASDDDSGSGTAGGDPAVPAAAAGARWVVQVAVFSSRETANQIRERLAGLGHAVSMDVLIRDRAELFRLRTGPYADEATADRARNQIDATVAGVDPVTRELSSGGSAEDRQGLAVQVGSFASHNNAERLVAQLTGAGFDAFMYGEETGGRTIWRVRVGAYEQRADAERLLETLREEQGLEGIVVSHP